MSIASLSPRVKSSSDVFITAAVAAVLEETSVESIVILVVKMSAACVIFLI